MALPLGPILLLAVVGGAVFGGLDVRKKRKKTAPIDNGTSEPAANQIVTCAHVIDFSADGKQASLDGGPWQSSEALDDQALWAVQRQRPQVVFAVCDPDPLVLQLLEQFCGQLPGVDFYGVYVHRLPATIQASAKLECQQQNALVAFIVNTPTGDTTGREYSSDYIPELILHRDGDATQVLSKVVLFTQGAEHPNAEDYEISGGGGA